jgi:hypothetical protein
MQTLRNFRERVSQRFTSEQRHINVALAVKSILILILWKHKTPARNSERD